MRQACLRQPPTWGFGGAWSALAQIMRGLDSGAVVLAAGGKLLTKRRRHDFKPGSLASAVMGLTYLSDYGCSSGLSALDIRPGQRRCRAKSAGLCFRQLASSRAAPVRGRATAGLFSVIEAPTLDDRPTSGPPGFSSRS